mmetsp:Transcript_44465/g.115048  ORF Transcript_44465/g.115048 Transcript_44465/m.115048 type:complete len:549 (+) Transcript_44465:294-1940(+)
MHFYGLGSVPVLLQKLAVEGRQALNDTADVLLAGEECSAEVPCAGALPEAAARHHHDAGGLQALHAVQKVRGLPARSGGLHRRGRQAQAGEAVHGALRALARDALQLVERRAERRRAPRQRGEHRVALRGVQLVRGVARLRRRHGARHRDLPAHVGAQVHAPRLEQLLLHRRVHPHQLHVAAAAAALAHEALGDRVQRDQLQPRGLRAHLARDPLERVEGLGVHVHVGLVHLVREEHQVVRAAEAHDLALVLQRQALPRGVARVDDHHGAHRQALRLARGERRGEVVRVEAPAGGLVEVVRHQLPARELDAGRVERVLRDGHQEGVRLAADEQLEHAVHRGGGAVRHVQVLRVRGEAVARLHARRHQLPARQRALARGVRARADDVRQDGVAAGHHVRRERALRHLVPQLGVVAQRDDLAHKRDRLLAELLRVPDVAVHQLVERQLLARRQTPGELVRLVHDGAAHRVLRLDEVGVDVVHGDQRLRQVGLLLAWALQAGGLRRHGLDDGRHGCGSAAGGVHVGLFSARCRRWRWGVPATPEAEIRRVR